MTKSHKIDTEQFQHWRLLPIVISLFFFIGLWIFFPTKTAKLYIKQKLTNQLQCSVAIDNIEFDLPATLIINDLELTAAPEIPVHISELTLAPCWMHLVKGNPTVQLEAKTLGGNIEGQFNTAHHIHLNATSLQLLDIPIPQLPDLRIQATVEQLDTSVNTEPVDQLEYLKLHLSKFSIVGLKQVGFPTDHLDLGNIYIHLRQSKQCIYIDKFKNSNGDFIIGANGFIIYKQNLLNSTIDIRLTFSPRTGLDPSITTTLPLFAKKQKNGQYSIRIGGTLAKPCLR